MNVLTEDLRNFLLSQSAISKAVGGGRVHYAHVPQDYHGAWIWFIRRTTGDESDRELTPETGRDYEYRETFDIEAVSKDLDESLDLIAEVKKLDSSRGTFGSGKVQAVFTRGHNDEYVSFASGGDEGLFVSTVEMEVVGYEPGG